MRDGHRGDPFSDDQVLIKETVTTSDKRLRRRLHTALVPSMRWPDRVADAALARDWTRAPMWEFFPGGPRCLSRPRPGLRGRSSGRTAQAVFNAANEDCVSPFPADA
jgi:1-deoxy-D-xylulose 5-phosphate reductoisomerase